MDRPAIGITRDSDGTPKRSDVSYPFYRDSVHRAGGEPISVYFGESPEEIGRALDQVDGLLLSGGDDLDPSLYGEHWHPKARPVDPRRQAWEVALISEAQRRRLPMLGICLGCQVMNVHRGGSLHQFLPELPRVTALEHRKVGQTVLRHEISIEPGSVLAEAVGSLALNVNTYHKQAINRPGRGLRIVATAPDGIIEAVEDSTLPLFLGVQWHPERISEERPQAALFELLVSRARQAATSRL